MSKGDLIIHLDLISCHFSDFFYMFVYVCQCYIHVDVSFILYFATENRSKGCLYQFKYIFLPTYIFGVYVVSSYGRYICVHNILCPTANTYITTSLSVSIPTCLWNTSIERHFTFIEINWFHWFVCRGFSRAVFWVQISSDVFLTCACYLLKGRFRRFVEILSCFLLFGY